MGLLDKTNPMATRESVIRWAIGGGIMSPAMIFLHLRRTPIPHRYWLPILIATAVLGAGLGALVEWQLDDGVAEDKIRETLPPGDLWDRELDHG
jgi:hypothetical protein